MTRSRRARAPLATVAVGVAAAGLVAGCSIQSAPVNRNPHTGSSVAAPGADQQITLVVDDHYRFTPSTITVHPGLVTITLIHRGQGAPHDFSVMGIPTDAVPLTDAGQTRSASFIAPAPGTYRFVCTIHITQGMTGTLIVLPS